MRSLKHVTESIFWLGLNVRSGVSKTDVWANWELVVVFGGRGGKGGPILPHKYVVDTPGHIGIPVFFKHRNSMYEYVNRGINNNHY